MIPNDPEFIRVFSELSPKRELIPLSRAKDDVTSTAGFYAIYIVSTEFLPDLFKEELEKRNEDCEFKNLLYLGKANKTNARNLRIRLVKEALMGGTHTFFRGLGAILGYKPPFGQLRNKSNNINYRFSSDDKRKIVEYIEQHIHIRWYESCVSSHVLDDLETNLIERLMPLMNIDKSPSPFQPFTDLRDRCIQRARGEYS